MDLDLSDGKPIIEILWIMKENTFTFVSRTASLSWKKERLPNNISEAGSLVESAILRVYCFQSFGSIFNSNCYKKMTQLVFPSVLSLAHSNNCPIVGSLVFIEYKSPPIDNEFEKLIKKCTTTDVSTETNVKRVSRFRFGITDQIVQQLSNPKSTSSFKDEYYYENLMKENIWVKKRTHSDQKEEWFVKFDVKNTNGFQFCEAKYSKNPILSPITDPVAVCSIVRTVYGMNGTNITVDKISYPKGDLSCCGTIDSVGDGDLQTLQKFIDDRFYPIRSTLLEYLFRYKKSLYEELKQNFFPDTQFLTCILDEQYKEMEKDGDDKYFELLNICQGLQFENACDDYDEIVDEIYKDTQ